MKKIIFALGLTLGYIIGSRQGRAAYDTLRGGANRAWRDRRVQRRVDDVLEVVEDRLPAASGAVSAAVDAINEKSDAIAADGSDDSDDSADDK